MGEKMIQPVYLAMKAVAVTFASDRRAGIKNAAATAAGAEEMRRGVLFRSAGAKARMGARTGAEFRGVTSSSPFGSVDGGSQGGKECPRLQVQQ
jgi:hypothetical protein